MHLVSDVLANPEIHWTLQIEYYLACYGVGQFLSKYASSFYTWLRNPASSFPRKIKNILRLDGLIASQPVDIQAAEFHWAEGESDTRPSTVTVTVRNPLTSELERFTIKGDSQLFRVIRMAWNFQNDNGRPCRFSLVYERRKHSLNRVMYSFWYSMYKIGLQNLGASLQRKLDRYPINYPELTYCEKDTITFVMEEERWNRRSVEQAGDQRTVVARYAREQLGVELTIEQADQAREIANALGTARKVLGGFTVSNAVEGFPKSKRRMPGASDNNLIFNARVEDIKVIEQAKVDEQQAHQDAMNRAYSNPPVSGIVYWQTYPHAEAEPARELAADTGINSTIQVMVDGVTGLIHRISEANGAQTRIDIYRREEAFNPTRMFRIFLAGEIARIDTARDRSPIRTMGSGEVASFTRGMRSYVVTLNNGEVYRS